MYEHLFEIERVRCHHAARPWAEYLERYTRELVNAGYHRRSVLSALYSWEAFLLWTRRKKVPLVEVDENTVVDFIRSASRRRKWRGRKISSDHVVGWHRPSLGHLLQFMREDGLIGSEVAADRPWYAQHIEALEDFLRRHRGASESIMEHRCREARYYVESLGVSSWQAALDGMNPDSIDVFLSMRSRQLRRSSLGLTGSALRTFFRYLYVSGQLPEDLAVQVPTVRSYKHASLPMALPWADVQKVIGVIDRDSPRGRRDYAVVMLMATYGLRGGEVTSLRLDDIDWRRCVVHVRQSKAQRKTTIPLLPEVGDAIIDYLKHGRPASSHREIFLAFPAPHRPLSRGGVLRWRLGKLLAAAGIEKQHWGTHTFRHSRAVHLLEQGCSFKSIGDLFGHQEPNSTFVYAKVHVEALRKVALDVEA